MLRAAASARRTSSRMSRGRGTPSAAAPSSRSSPRITSPRSGAHAPAGLEIVGAYHSHPSGPVGPIRDRSRAADRSVDVPRHRVAGAWDANRPRVPAHRRELQSAGTRPCAVMTGLRGPVPCRRSWRGRSAAQDPPVPSQPPQVFRELRLEGATVYKPDDVLWLLRLREGSPLPGDAGDVGAQAPGAIRARRLSRSARHGQLRRRAADADGR